MFYVCHECVKIKISFLIVISKTNRIFADQTY